MTMIRITTIAIGGLLTLAQVENPNTTMARCIDAAAAASKPEASVEVYVRHAMFVQACMEIHGYQPDVTRCPELAIALNPRARALPSGMGHRLVVGCYQRR
jgi:hypothetical protein